MNFSGSIVQEAPPRVIANVFPDMHHQVEKNGPGKGIFNAPTKAPLLDARGYYWRGTGFRSARTEPRKISKDTEETRDYD
jgi:hypothetical protein